MYQGLCGCLNLSCLDRSRTAKWQYKMVWASLWNHQLFAPTGNAQPSQTHPPPRHLPPLYKPPPAASCLFLIRSFIDSIEKYGKEQTYANLLAHMTQALRALGKSSVSKPNGAASAVAMAAPMLGAVALVSSMAAWQRFNVDYDMLWGEP